MVFVLAKASRTMLCDCFFGEKKKPQVRTCGDGMLT